MKCTNNKFPGYAEAVTATGAFIVGAATFLVPTEPGTAVVSSFRSSEGAFAASGELEEWLILAFFFFLSKPEKHSFDDEFTIQWNDLTCRNCRFYTINDFSALFQVFGVIKTMFLAS